MLDAAVKGAGLDGLFDQILSVEAVGVYKPNPKVYQLAVDALGITSPHFVPIVERLGRLCCVGLRNAGGLVQPLRSAVRAAARRTRPRDSDPGGVAGAGGGSLSASQQFAR